MKYKIVTASGYTFIGDVEQQPAMSCTIYNARQVPHINDPEVGPNLGTVVILDASVFVEVKS